MIYKIFEKTDHIFFRRTIFLPVIAILAIGLLELYYINIGNAMQSNFLKQLFWILIGLIVIFLTQHIKIQFFYEYAYHFYFILIVLLVITNSMETKAGVSRWFSIGSFSFQPSEIGKFILVISLSRLLSVEKISENNFKYISASILMCLVPFYLIMKQPDLGTGLIYIAIIFPMLFVAEVNKYIIFILISPMLSSMLVFNLTFFYIWMSLLLLVVVFNGQKIADKVLVFFINIIFGIASPIFWNSILSEFQRQRILSFLNPQLDPQGSSYQVIQSIIAIGSGGLFGRGLGMGTQTQLRYLPVSETDFIISVIGEELGFVGIIVILTLFLFFLYWMLRYGSSINNKFYRLVISGISFIFFIHIIINCGMCIGILPVTGLPMPLLSYGGSFLLSVLFMIGVSNKIINSYL
jgi:rod shape determining protein RodA